ncbi:MAG: polysaccharide biosynthesis/export family protein [Acidobacteriota bacterium]
MKYTLKSTLVFALTVALIAPVFAQSQEKPPFPTVREGKQPESPTRRPENDIIGPRSNVVATGDEDYRIGAGDTIDIRVADAEELSGTFRVRADGTIKMHFIGRVLVLDKTTEELSTEIANGLRGRYLFEPRVSINVTELTSKSIYLQGAVAKPGVYQIDGRPHLLQALVYAGGLQQNHGATAYIIRRTKVSDEDIKAHETALKLENDKAAAKAIEEKASEAKTGDSKEPGAEKPAEKSAEKADGEQARADEPTLQEGEWLAKQYKLVKLNINGLFKGAFDQNMFLQPGDIINIPSTDLFFVSGQVKAPGSFPLKEGTTLRQALALSQGFTSTASPGKGIIFRENPETAKRTEISVDMGGIMSGKKEDVAIYANDIILVPNSGFKTVALPLLTAATSSVMTALLLRAIGY